MLVFNIFLKSSGIELRDYISDIPANYQTPSKDRPIVSYENSENQEKTNKKPMSSYENPETTSMSNGFPVARSLVF